MHEPHDEEGDYLSMEAWTERLAELSLHAPGLHRELLAWYELAGSKPDQWAHVVRVAHQAMTVLEQAEATIAHIRLQAAQGMHELVGYALEHLPPDKAADLARALQRSVELVRENDESANGGDS